MQKHILIVDDEAEIRELLNEFLSGHGYRVTGVASALEALRLAPADPPDLIISDLQLEESDGLTMIDQLKTHLPDTPVILLTGVMFDPKVFHETLGHKVSSYLMKTTPLSRIRDEIARLLHP